MMGGMARERDAAHEPRACDAALARAFDFLGKRWNGVLLGTLLEGPAGFSELRRSVAGISDSVLSDRLVELTRAGLVQRFGARGPAGHRGLPADPGRGGPAPGAARADDLGGGQPARRRGVLDARVSMPWIRRSVRLGHPECNVEVSIILE